MIEIPAECTYRAPGTVGNLLRRAREKARPLTPHAGEGYRCSSIHSHQS